MLLPGPSFSSSSELSASSLVSEWKVFLFILFINFLLKEARSRSKYLLAFPLEVWMVEHVGLLLALLRKAVHVKLHDYLKLLQPVGETCHS